MSNAQVLIDSFQIYTHKQLVAASDLLPIIDNAKKTFQAIARSANFQVKGKLPESSIPYSWMRERTGLGKDAVIAHVKIFVDLGLITKVKQGYICKRTGQRRQACNIYTFQLPKIIKYCDKLRAKIFKSDSHNRQVEYSNRSTQITNIKRTAIVGFSSIKAMFSKKTKGQYVDPVTGLLFATYDKRNDYRNAVGYIPTRPRSRLIYEAITYHASNNLDVVLDAVWLKQIEDELKAKESSKSQIDYQFFTYATATHTYNVGCYYFKDEASRLAIIERDRQW